MSSTRSPAPKPAAFRPPLPEGIHHVYFFEIFNTISFSVVLGSPMLLFLQHLDASATLLAVAACLAPVLLILQIPAAHFVERVGYRRFVLSGWITRSFFVLGMAVVAFLPESVGRTPRIAAMLLLSFGYNTLRGIAACGLLPWFTHIVPEERRGEFLARDQLAGTCAAIVALFGLGLLLEPQGSRYAYGWVYAIGTASAFLSLPFLRRIPDVPVEKIVKNPSPVPWRNMFFHPPFFRYICYNMVVSSALGASSVFWVRYFRAFLHVSPSHVLLFAAASLAVLALGLILLAPLIDRSGNRPALTLSGVLLCFHYGGWGAIAGGLLPFNLLTISLQCFTSGIGGSLWNLANVRTVMGIVPEMGRAHFLALYSVAGNLTMGLVPLAWGPVMDHLETWRVDWGWWHWNCYSLFYTVLVVTSLIALVLLRRVAEPASMSWEVFTHELLVKTPSRAVSRLINRMRGFGIG